MLWGAQLQTVEENTFLRLSTYVVANGSGLGPIPVVRMRKEDDVSGFGGLARKGGWNMQVHWYTLASLGAHRRCLCAMPRDCSLL